MDADPPTPPPQPDHSPEREPDPSGGGHSAPAKRPRHPALKRTVIKPARVRPDPVDAAFVATRLTTLTHELSNLLDGSLRVISLARRSLPGPCDSGEAPSPERLAKHLDTVHAAMKQMAELVRCSMNGSPLQRLDGVRAAVGSTGSLAEALQHAVDVMTPLADEQGVRIVCEVHADLAHVRAGPIFGILTAAIRNGIESVQSLGGVGGHIEISARIEGERDEAEVVIDIADDGQGPPRTPGHRPDAVFRYGFTTKPGGRGVGLAVSRDLARQLRGRIRLDRRTFNPETGRGGAVLRVRYPVPPSVFVGDEEVGGAE